MNTLEIHGLSVYFGSRPILNELSWLFEGPGLYALMGPGGVGKSTLSRVLSWAVQGAPYFQIRGQILLDGKALGPNHKAALVEQRLRLGLGSFRDALVEALPHRASLTWSEQDEACAAHLERAGLSSMLDKLGLNMLSMPKHEQKLAALACALLSEPSLLCIDEPTAGLSDEEAAPLLAALKVQSQQRAVLWVSHHQQRVREFADVTALLAAGRIWSSRPTNAFFNDPEDLLCQQFVGSGGYELSWPSSDPELINQQITALSQRPGQSTSSSVPPSQAPVTLQPPSSQSITAEQHVPQELRGLDDDDTIPYPAGYVAQPADAEISIYQRDAQVMAQLFPEQAKHYPRDSVGPQGFHWLVPGRVAGTPRPGIVMDMEFDLGALKRAGINRLVTLEEDPMTDPLIQERGFAQVHFPIVDMEAPEMERCVALMTELDAWLCDPKARIAFHCKAGLGRTGTILVAALVWRGMEAQDALLFARRIFNGWVQSQTQITFLEDFAAYLSQQRSSAESTLVP